MGLKHISGDDLESAMRYICQQRFATIGFNHKKLIPKPKLPANVFERATQLINQQNETRYNKLMNIPANLFANDEQIRTYATIVYMMLHQAPNRMNFTNDLIQQNSLNVTINNVHKEYPVQREHIKPVWDIISELPNDDPDHEYTKPFIREPGYREPGMTGRATSIITLNLDKLAELTQPRARDTQRETKDSCAKEGQDFTRSTPRVVHTVSYSSSSLSHVYVSAGQARYPKTQIGVRGTSGYVAGAGGSYNQNKNNYVPPAREVTGSTKPPASWTSIDKWVAEHCTYQLPLPQLKNEIKKRLTLATLPTCLLEQRYVGSCTRRDGTTYSLREWFIKSDPDHEEALLEIRDELRTKYGVWDTFKEVDRIGERRKLELTQSLEILHEMSKRWRK